MWFFLQIATSIVKRSENIILSSDTPTQGSDILSIALPDNNDDTIYLEEDVSIFIYLT